MVIQMSKLIQIAYLMHTAEDPWDVHMMAGPTRVHLPVFEWKRHTGLIF